MSSLAKGGNGTGNKASPPGQQQQMPFWGWGPYANYGWSQWATPPCPMPTQGWARPPPSNNKPGVEMTNSYKIQNIYHYIYNR